MLDQWETTKQQSNGSNSLYLTLLLQKPSKKSKAKNHLKALERRLKLWGKENINKLVNESNTMQGRPLYTNTSMHTKNPLCKSKQSKQVANVNGALRRLINNLSNSIIPVSYETLGKLNLKDSGSKQACIDLLLHDPRKPITDTQT